MKKMQRQVNSSQPYFQLCSMILNLVKSHLNIRGCIFLSFRYLLQPFLISERREKEKKKHWNYISFIKINFLKRWFFFFCLFTSFALILFFFILVYPQPTQTSSSFLIFFFYLLLFLAYNFPFYFYHLYLISPDALWDFNLQIDV